MLKITKKILSSAGLGLLMLPFSVLSTPTLIDRIVVFGDSLSDDGNLYQLSYEDNGVISKIPHIKQFYPDGYVPSQFNRPYYGGRFSNGKTWVEDLGNLFGLKDTNTHRRGLFTDYAYGGAWAADFNTEKSVPSPNVFPPSLGLQVTTYEAEHLLARDKQHSLVIIMAGANDYLPGRSHPDQATDNAVSAIDRAVARLYAHGIHEFVVVGLPNLGLTYDAYKKGPDFMASEQKLALLHDQKLAASLQAFSRNPQKYPDLHLTYFDWTPWHQSLLAHFQEEGFKYDYHQPCHPGEVIPENGDSDHKLLELVGGVVHSQTAKMPTVNDSCDSDADLPSEHVYMDPVHPTRVVHCMVALIACHFLQDQYVGEQEGQPVPLHCGLPDSEDPTVLTHAAAAQCWVDEKAGLLQADQPIPAQ